MLTDCAKYDGTILIAADGEELLAYASVLTTLTSKNFHDEILYTYANVTDLIVTKSQRGTGIGRRLLENCEEIARAAGVKWLRITVLADNTRAVQTYKKFGFAPPPPSHGENSRLNLSERPTTRQ